MTTTFPQNLNVQFTETKIYFQFRLSSQIMIVLILRLDNGDVMINSGDSFFGGIYRQQRMETTSIGNRSPLDYPSLYLNFKVKDNHIYVYPSNTPIKIINSKDNTRKKRDNIDLIYLSQMISSSSSLDNCQSAEQFCKSEITQNYDLFKRVYDHQPDVFTSCNILDKVAAKGCVEVFKMLERQTTPIQLTCTTAALSAALSNANWPMVDYLINNRTEGCPYNVIHNILDGESTPSDKSKAIQIIDDHIQDNSRPYLQKRADLWKYVNSIELARSLAPPNTIDVGENVVESYLNDLLSLEYEEFFQFENVGHHFITVQLDIVYYLTVNVLHHSLLSYQQLDDIRSQFKDIQFIERQTPIFKYQSQETTYPYLTMNDQELDNWNTFIAFKIILIEVISAMKTLHLRQAFKNAIFNSILTGSTIVIPILFSNYYKKGISSCIYSESSTLFDFSCGFCTLEQVKVAYAIVQEYRSDKLLQWSLHKANRPLLITATAARKAAKSNNLEVLKYLDEISESKLAPFHLKVSRFNFQARTAQYLISTRPNSLLPHYSYQRALETLDLDFINWYDNFVKQNQSIIDQFKMKDKKNGQRNDYPIILSRSIIERIFVKSNHINLLEYIINKYNITNNLDSIKGIFKSEDIIYHLMSECCEQGNLEIFKWLELNLNLSSQSKIQQPQRIATTIFDDAYLNGMNDDLVEYLIDNRFEGFGPESWKYVGESGDVKQLQLMIRGTNQQQHNQLFNTIAKFAIRRGNMKILNQNMIPDEIISFNLTNCNIRHTIRDGIEPIIQMYLKQATINEIESILQHSIRSEHPRCTKLIYQELIKQQKQQSIPPYQLTIKDQLHLISIENIVLLDYFIQQQSLDPKLIDRKQMKHMFSNYHYLGDQMKRYLLDKGFNSKWEPSTKVQLESKSLRFNTTTANREKSFPKERSIRLVFGNVYLLRKILRETRFTQSGYRVSIPMDIRLDIKWLLSKRAYNWIKYLIRRKEPLHVYGNNATYKLVLTKDVELFQVVYEQYRSSFFEKCDSLFSLYSLESTVYSLEQLSKQVDPYPYFPNYPPFENRAYFYYHYPTLSVLFDKELMEKELSSFIKESDSIPEKPTRYYPKEMVSTSLDKQKKDEDEEEEDDDGDDEEEDWLNYQKSDIIDWHHHNVNSFKQDKSPVLHIKMKIEVVDFIHRNRTESFSAKDLEKIDNINILRYLQHYRPDLVIGSSLFDRSIINQKYEVRNHLLFSFDDITCTSRAYNTLAISQYHLLSSDLQVPFDSSLYKPKCRPSLTAIKFLIHIGLDLEKAFDLTCGSDDETTNFILKQMKREHLSKIPSGSDPFFKYDTKLISRLMPSESFSQDINMQIIDTRLVCEVDEEKRDDFIQKIYNNKVKLNKPILDYLYNNGVPFKEYIIDSLLDIGDERLNDIDPKEFLETHVHNCASYENTQHLATRLLSIQRNILYLLDNGAPLSVFSELDLKKTSDFKVLQHNRRDCFKMVIDKLKEETKDMDIETGRKTIESVVDKMGFDRLGEGTECSTLMLEYCLELITKDLPSGILSQEKMEQRYAKLVKHYHFDLALVVSKYFNIGFDTIKKYKFFSKIPFQAAIFFGNSFNLAFEDFPIELLSNLSQKQQDFLKDKFHCKNN
ncbi:hypothetical protein DFA_09221 [Cavenderia fasciculata]|uniref:Uncharacterized protein n=1 Tax=Cavenderia fasciculata TaxID=261658 RepID=F4Q711_CACFS|nr:uncharacterized protein DFA_09221 [Cavenderia fasciculata]EGG16193.1 hypothetical protein DFA_09221 [Cavenderia fasciculata]|eukprot:XP_004354577.1 hypothetical protein DFA_09221 [Cavenderia fasciculata]